MISRRLLAIFVLGLPVLLVIFAVVMGGYLLAQQTEDAVAGSVLRWVGVACLMLLVIDVVLLVAALGIRALEQEEEPADQDRS